MPPPNDVAPDFHENDKKLEPLPGNRIVKTKKGMIIKGSTGNRTSKQGTGGMEILDRASFCYRGTVPIPGKIEITQEVYDAVMTNFLNLAGN